MGRTPTSRCFRRGARTRPPSGRSTRRTTSRSPPSRPRRPTPSSRHKPELEAAELHMVEAPRCPGLMTAALPLAQASGPEHVRCVPCVTTRGAVLRRGYSKDPYCVEGFQDPYCEEGTPTDPY